MRTSNIMIWLALTLLLVPTTMSAQSVETVNDSIDENEAVVDTISADELIINSLDSIINDMKEFDNVELSPNPRYAFVTKDGKMGIFDMTRMENVTKIEFDDIWFSMRSTSDTGNMTLFRFQQGAKFGVLGVYEPDNSYRMIYFTDPDEE